ncbi:FAD:protein FMN transferase [Nocardioides sp.]|uniref:FAD:protein FMN transferase n=1 Tax=Nocardioides sp. TaxID=35761 RepID=UPI0035158E8B
MSAPAAIGVVRRPLWRRSAAVMGTVASVAVRGSAEPGDGALERAWAAAIGELRWVDEVFSTYRPASVVNRWGRGELALADAPAELAEVLAIAARARVESNGAFDIAAVRSPHGGGPDPSGVVKGWAVERAARHLEALGRGDFCLSVGGDLVCRVASPDSPAWRIGVEHPDDPTRLLATVALGDAALATSGSARRGAHIRDPRREGARWSPRGRAVVAEGARDGLREGVTGHLLRQVTVIGPRLTEVDIEATAAVVLGPEAGDWLAARGRTAVLVDDAGAVRLLGADDAALCSSGTLTA